MKKVSYPVRLFDLRLLELLDINVLFCDVFHMGLTYFFL